jgi:hypothetical protein
MNRDRGTKRTEKGDLRSVKAMLQLAAGTAYEAAAIASRRLKLPS